MRRTNAERAGDQVVVRRSVDALGRDAQQQPSRRTGEPSFLRLEIIDGGTIDVASDTKGLLGSAFLVQTVNAKYDPTRGGIDNPLNVLDSVGQFTAQTGIGRAILYVDNEPRELVLVVLDQRAPASLPDLIGHGRDSTLTLGAVEIPVTGGRESIIAYVPYLL